MTEKPLGYEGFLKLCDILPTYPEGTMIESISCDGGLNPYSQTKDEDLEYGTLNVTIRIPRNKKEVEHYLEFMGEISTDENRMDRIERYYEERREILKEK